MGRVFSFINYKGGVGKTTLAVEIAAALANSLNVKVLLVDVDPQTNATFYLMSEEQWDQRAQDGLTFREIFNNFLEDRINDPHPMLVTF